MSHACGTWYFAARQTPGLGARREAAGDRAITLYARAGRMLRARRVLIRLRKSEPEHLIPRLPSKRPNVLRSGACELAGLSGCPDLNRGPLRPKRSALANCATPRIMGASILAGPGADKGASEPGASHDDQMLEPQRRRGRREEPKDSLVFLCALCASAVISCAESLTLARPAEDWPPPKMIGSSAARGGHRKRP